MSAVVAVSAGPGSASAEAILAACSIRGAIRPTLVDHGPATLGVARRSWEFAAGFSGPVTVVEEDDLAVVADATLYYTDALLAGLGNERPRGGSPSHRILAAYRKWGAELSTHLEGDFGFVIADRARSRIVASRDFAGARPLFYAEGNDAHGRWIALSSCARALLADPRVTDELDVPIVAATAAGLLSDAGPRTSFKDVRWLPAGSTLTWSADSGSDVVRHWSPPPFTRTKQSFEEAAAELRQLLFEATRERLSAHGITGVSLSGGWDSPAVFGAARDVAQTSDMPAEVVAVSISYPEGDPGREDELIAQIAERWDAPVHWLQSTEIPILADPVRGAAVRDQPWAHIYEQWNRRLPQTLAEVDARVLLSGYGGDQLFQVSDIYLADLFWSGRFLQLRREWKAKGGDGFRRFFKWAVEPGLPGWALGLIAKLRGGKPLTPYIHRKIPDWFRADYPGRAELDADHVNHEPPRHLKSRVEAEAYWYLAEPMFPRVNAAITQFALEADVEHRTPLYDRRIVAFAATRPWSDRSFGKETKRLLRAASRGWVPDPVLAPRPARTGTTDGYARDKVGEDLPGLLDTLRRQPMRLAELGIIDADEFDAACEQLLSSPYTGLEHPIFLTAQTELWLRGLDVPAAEASRASV